jgi:hypothetical protein
VSRSTPFQAGAFASQWEACLTEGMLLQEHQKGIYILNMSCLKVLSLGSRKVQKKWSVWPSMFTLRLELQDSSLAKSEGLTSGDGQARLVQLSY